MLLNLFRPLFDLIGIKHSPNLPKVVNNAGWMLLDNAIRFLLGLWVVSWMARYLGPDDFGLFNYALALVSLLSLFATLGLNEMVVRFVLTYPLRKDEVLTSAFFLRCISGSIAFIFSLLLVFLLRPSGDITVWLTAIIAFSLIFQAFDVIDSYFQSQLQSKYTVLAKISVFIVLSLVKIYLIIIKAPLIAFAWTALAEIILSAIGLLIIYQSLGFRLNFNRFDKGMAKDLISGCLPICGGGLAAMGMARIGQILLLQLRGSYEAGIYAAAIRISEMWGILGSVIIISVFPVILRLKNENEILYRHKLRLVYNIFYAFGITASVLTAIFAKPIIGLLYGPAYQSAVPVLMIHVFTVTLVFIGGATTYVLVAENFQPYHLLRMLLGCFVSFLLSWILIPTYGALGAATAALISYGVSVYSIFVFKPLRKIF